MVIKAFSLPGGMSNWHKVEERMAWCEERFGKRELGGTWEYSVVSHMIIVRGEKNIMLYVLRWG